MIAKYLWLIASLVIIIIGLLHFRGTFFTNLLHPRNKELIEKMKKSPLNLTDKLPIWNPWIGFNAAFSNGALFLGITFFYMGLEHFSLLHNSLFIQLLAIISSGVYVWISGKYLLPIVTLFFSISLISYSIACLYIQLLAFIK